MKSITTILLLSITILNNAHSMSNDHFGKKNDCIGDYVSAANIALHKSEIDSQLNPIIMESFHNLVDTISKEIGEGSFCEVFNISRFKFSPRIISWKKSKALVNMWIEFSMTLRNEEGEKKNYPISFQYDLLKDSSMFLKTKFPSIPKCNNLSCIFPFRNSVELMNTACDLFNTLKGSDINITQNPYPFSYTLFDRSLTKGESYSVPYFYLIDSLGKPQVNISPNHNVDSIHYAIGYLEDFGHINAYPIFKLKIISDIKNTLGKEDVFVVGSATLHGPNLRPNKLSLFALSKIKPSKFTAKEITNINSFRVAGGTLTTGYPDFFKYALGPNFNCKQVAVNIEALNDQPDWYNQYDLSCKKKHRENIIVKDYQKKSKDDKVRVSLRLYSEFSHVSLVNEIIMIVKYDGNCVSKSNSNKHFIELKTSIEKSGVVDHYIPRNVDAYISKKKGNELEIKLKIRNDDIFHLLPVKRKDMKKGARLQFSESLYSPLIDLVFSLPNGMKTCESEIIKSVEIKKAFYRNYKEGANPSKRKFEEKLFY